MPASGSRLLLLVLVAGLGGAVSGACHLSGSVTGEDLTDAGVRSVTALAPPCAPILDPLPTPNDVAAGFDGGSKWSDLYHDYFGPTGKPGSCSYRSSCHGPDAVSNSASGANNKAGIRCFDDAGVLPDGGRDPILDREACRQSFINKNVSGADVLRKCVPPTTDGGDSRALGIMPQEPSNATFSDLALRRFQDWVDQKYPDN